MFNRKYIFNNVGFSWIFQLPMCVFRFFFWGGTPGLKQAMPFAPGCPAPCHLSAKRKVRSASSNDPRPRFTSQHDFARIFADVFSEFIWFPTTQSPFTIVGGWSFNPFEKYDLVKLGSSSPNMGENEKYLKPPPSLDLVGFFNVFR